MKTKRLRDLFLWLTATPSRHLRSVLVLTIVSVVVLGGCGFMVALLWPEHWSAILASFIVGVLATVVGVLLAIPVAIFIVEGYLERRRREAAEEAELEEQRYKAGWSVYLHGGIAALAGILMHVSFFVAYGKEKYLQAFDEVLFEVPETLSGFFPALFQEVKRTLDEKPKSSRDGSAQSRGWNEEHAARLTRAFQEPPSARDFTRSELTLLICQLRALKVFLQNELYLFVPYMSRHMGVASALTDVSMYLGRAIEETEVVLAPWVEPSGPSSSVQLTSNLLSIYCSLGAYSVELRRMIGAGRKDLDLTVKTETYSSAKTTVDDPDLPPGN